MAFCGKAFRKLQIGCPLNRHLTTNKPNHHRPRDYLPHGLNCATSPQTKASDAMESWWGGGGVWRQMEWATDGGNCGGICKWQHRILKSTQHICSLTNTGCLAYLIVFLSVRLRNAKKVVKPESVMGENNGVSRVMEEISRVQFEKPIRFEAVCEKNNVRGETVSKGKRWIIVHD